MNFGDPPLNTDLTLTQNKVSGQRGGSRGIAAARYIAAFYLVGIWIDPRLVSGGLITAAVPAYDYQWYRSLPGVIVALSLCLGALLLFIPYLKDDSHKRGLWFVLLFWLNYCILGAILQCADNRARHMVLPDGIPCIFLVHAVSAGLLAARITAGVEKLALVVVLASTIQSCYAIVKYIITDHPFLSGTVPRAIGSFTNPQDLTRVLLCSLPFALGLIKVERRTWARFFFLIAAAILFLALVLTWDRGGVCALMVGLVYTVHYLYPTRRRLVFSTMVLLCGLLIFTFHIRSAGPLNNASSNRSIQSRTGFWVESLTVVGKHSFGVGYEGLTLPVHNLQGTVVGSTNDVKNIFLFWLVALGYPGAILLLSAIYNGLRIMSISNSSSMVALKGSWISILVAGMFDTPFGSVNALPATMVVAAMLGVTLISAPNSMAPND